MRVNVLILLALSAVTAANSGCTSCRNWLHRGSICGTKTAAPAMMGSPVALGTPYVQQPQFMQPMAAPMQQMVMPQANCQCAPQCMPTCQPMSPCQPCCDPCANMCSPCGPSTWSGGYMDGGCCEESTTPASTYDGGTSTYDSGTIVPSPQQPSLPSTYTPPPTNDPGPARVNYPDSAKPADETN